MTFAPSRAAVSTAAARLANELLLASTRRILQFGQTALTMSRSSEISCAQPLFERGGVVPPVWFTLRKQPFAVVHAGNPNCARYTPRSLSALGSSKASTMATTWPAPAAVFSLYAEARSAGLWPVGPAVAAGFALPSTRTHEWQRAPSTAAEQTRACWWPAPSAEAVSSSIGELPPHAAARAATTIATRSFIMS